MKKCELCSKVARMYCESDEASLCWDCDSRVHSANFLVAKHTRTLLCHACQRLTPWTGSGPKLGPTVSVCEACAHAEDDDTEGNGRQSDDDDDTENQVVPLSLPPSLASTSSENDRYPKRRRRRRMVVDHGDGDNKRLKRKKGFKGCTMRLN